MKKTYVMTFISILLFNFSVQASCFENIEKTLEQKHEKLLSSKIKQKKVLIKTAIGTGVPSAVFWGIMFKLVADGATIGPSILVGAGFGAATAGAAVGVVAIPMITYNQIIKGQIRGLNKTYELLTASNNSDLDNKLLKKMYKKVSRRDRSLTMDKMVTLINQAHESDIFCQANEKVYNFKKIKRYLLNEPVLLAEEVEVTLL